MAGQPATYGRFVFPFCGEKIPSIDDPCKPYKEGIAQLVSNPA